MGSTGFEPVTSSVSTKRSPPELTAREPWLNGAPLSPRLLSHTRNYSGEGAICKEDAAGRKRSRCEETQPGLPGLRPVQPAPPHPAPRARLQLPAGASTSPELCRLM